MDVFGSVIQPCVMHSKGSVQKDPGQQHGYNGKEQQKASVPMRVFADRGKQLADCPGA